MSFKIFVSYSTEDMGVVKELQGYLQDPSVDVFVAEYSVLSGEQLNASIVRAIKE